MQHRPPVYGGRGAGRREVPSRIFDQACPQGGTLDAKALKEVKLHIKKFSAYPSTGGEAPDAEKSHHLYSTKRALKEIIYERTYSHPPSAILDTLAVVVLFVIRTCEEFQSFLLRPTSKASSVLNTDFYDVLVTIGVFILDSYNKPVFKRNISTTSLQHPLKTSKYFFPTIYSYQLNHECKFSSGGSGRW